MITTPKKYFGLFCTCGAGSEGRAEDAAIANFRAIWYKNHPSTPIVMFPSGKKAYEHHPCSKEEAALVWEKNNPSIKDVTPGFA